MATLTPRLQLKRNDGSDPFLRQDFVDNWNKLDAAPGVHVCTSTSRPTWSAAQGGRLAFETDTRRFIYWSGTAWTDPLVSPSSWALSVAPNQYLTKGATATYTLGSITTSRPGNLLVISTMRVAAYLTANQNLSPYGLIDGTDRTIGGNAATINAWVAAGGVAAGSYDNRVATFFSQVAVNAGTHTIGARAVVGNSSTNQVYIGGVAAIAILTNTSSL